MHHHIDISFPVLDMEDVQLYCGQIGEIAVMDRRVTLGVIVEKLDRPERGIDSQRFFYTFKVFSCSALGLRCLDGTCTPESTVQAFAMSKQCTIGLRLGGKTQSGGQRKAKCYAVRKGFHVR